MVMCQIEQPDGNDNVNVDRGISMEQVEKLSDDPKVKDLQTEEEKQLMQEWEAHMHDFIPEDISTIVIEPR